MRNRHSRWAMKHGLNTRNIGSHLAQVQLEVPPGVFMKSSCRLVAKEAGRPKISNQEALNCIVLTHQVPGGVLEVVWLLGTRGAI